MGFSLLKNIDQNQIARNLVSLCEYNLGESDSLYRGNLGKSVSLFNLAEYYGKAEYYEKALANIRKVVNRIGEKEGLRFSTAHSRGLSGLGNVLLLMDKSSFKQDSPQNGALLDWIAKKIYQNAKVEIVNSDLDPLYSSLGGLYFLVNFYRAQNSGRYYIEDLVNELYEKIELNQIGRFVPNKRFCKGEQQAVPFGIAHGICGLVLVLLELKEVLDNEKLRALIKISLDFMQRLFRPYEKSERFFLFPRAVSLGGSSLQQEKTNENIGWCSSDVSVIYTFLRAGDQLEDKGISQFANRILSDFLNFDQTSLPIYNVNLCHGSAGMALLYQKCFEITNIPDCFNASQFWLNRTLQNLPEPASDNLWFGKQGAYNVLLSTEFAHKHWTKILFLK